MTANRQSGRLPTGRRDSEDDPSLVADSLAVCLYGEIIKPRSHVGGVMATFGFSTDREVKATPTVRKTDKTDDDRQIYLSCLALSTYLSGQRTVSAYNARL